VRRSRRRGYRGARSPVPVESRTTASASAVSERRIARSRKASHRGIGIKRGVDYGRRATRCRSASRSSSSWTSAPSSASSR
jgi:hypothetical protein